MNQNQNPYAHPFPPAQGQALAPAAPQGYPQQTQPGQYPGTPQGYPPPQAPAPQGYGQMLGGGQGGGYPQGPQGYGQMPGAPGGYGQQGGYAQAPAFASGQLDNVLGEIENTEPLTERMPRLGIGQHTVILTKFFGRNSAKGYGTILTAEFVIEKSSIHIPGERRSWLFFP